MDPSIQRFEPAEVTNCTRDFFTLSWLFLLLPSSFRQRHRWSFPSAILVTALRNIWWPASPSSFFVLRSGASSEIATVEIAGARKTQLGR